jgi:hypothetical protein
VELCAPAYWAGLTNSFRVVTPRFTKTAGLTPVVFLHYRTRQIEFNKVLKPSIEIRNRGPE